MMLKTSKGITMIVLVITVIVLLIITSITTYTGISTIADSRYYSAISQMKVMQSNVNQWYEDYIAEGSSTSWDLGVDLDDSGNQTQAIKAYNSVNTNNVNGTDIGEIDDYRYFSVDYITQNLDIEGISYDFIINITTRTVILVEGVTYNDITYYSLEEIEGEQYNIEYQQD